jgi:uncharacterized protein YqeY
MLADDLKARMMQAMKEKDEVARTVLGVARGEVQTAEARANRPLADEEVAAILRKLVKSNEETLAAAPDGQGAAALKREIEVLTALLPSRLTLAQLVDALTPQRDAIRAAKSDGQATGIAMKHLKSTGASFDGTDAATAVKQIRATAT